MGLSGSGTKSMNVRPHHEPPGSAGVSPASPEPKTGTRRRDASAPRKCAPEPACRGGARHSVRAVCLDAEARRARSDAPYQEVHGEGGHKHQLHCNRRGTKKFYFSACRNVPSFSVKRADNGVHGEVAGKFAAQNEFIHIRFILKPPGRTAGPTVELERDEFLQFYELKLVADLAQLRKRHFAAAFQYLPRRQQINLYSIPSVFHAIIRIRHAIKRPIRLAVRNSTASSTSGTTMSTSMVARG